MPTADDILTYKSLRALGIRQGNNLFFDSEDMASVLMDCCLYDWKRLPAKNAPSV